MNNENNNNQNLSILDLITIIGFLAQMQNNYIKKMMKWFKLLKQWINMKN